MTITEMSTRVWALASQRYSVGEGGGFVPLSGGTTTEADRWIASESQSLISSPKDKVLQETALLILADNFTFQILGFRKRTLPSNICRCDRGKAFLGQRGMPRPIR